MCSLARATITKYHRLVGLNNRHLFPHNSGSLKSKVSVSPGLVSSDVSPLDLWIAVFSLYLHKAFPLGIFVLITSSYKNTNY